MPGTPHPFAEIEQILFHFLKLEPLFHPVRPVIITRYFVYEYFRGLFNRGIPLFISHTSYGFYHSHGIRPMMNDLITGVGDTFTLKLIMRNRKFT